jgi:hypothetical protein
MNMCKLLQNVTRIVYYFKIFKKRSQKKHFPSVAIFIIIILILMGQMGGYY